MPPSSPLTYETATPEPRAKLIALGVVLPVIASIFVALRVWVRRSNHTQLGLDDTFIFCGVVLVWGMGITQIIGSSGGNLGQPIPILPNGAPDLTSQQSVVFSQTEWAFQIIEKLAFGFIKLSVLMFYRRIFLGRNFNIVTWVMIVVTVIWTLAFFWVVVFYCKTHFILIWSPNRAEFLQNCLPITSYGLAFAWSDIFTDVLILAIPVPMVLRLHMAARKKFLVLGVFILGFLTVLAGVARFIFYYRATADFLGADVPINTAPTIYWSLVQASVAVVAACLPLLRPIFQGLSPESVLGSLRERISLRSLRRSGGSGNSDRSKAKPQAHARLNPRDDQGPGHIRGESDAHDPNNIKMGAIYTGANAGESWSEAARSDVNQANSDRGSEGAAEEQGRDIRVTTTVTQTTGTLK